MGGKLQIRRGFHVEASLRSHHTRRFRIIASERIKAFRKDVLTKSGKTVGGGDQTRKMKLLAKQKKGKKRAQESGKVSLSQAAFNSVISRGS